MTLFDIPGMTSSIFHPAVYKDQNTNAALRKP